MEHNVTDTGIEITIKKLLKVLTFSQKSPSLLWALSERCIWNDIFYHRLFNPTDYVKINEKLENGKINISYWYLKKKITRQTCPMSRLGGGHPGHGQREQHPKRDLHLDSVRELGTVTRITCHLSGISLFLTIHCWDCWI